MRRLNWYILNYLNLKLLCTNITTPSITTELFKITLTTEKTKKKLLNIYFPKNAVGRYAYYSSKVSLKYSNVTYFSPTTID